MIVPDTVSKKCKYALRAIFELTFRDNNQPVATQALARAQGIPARFLEVIMAELRHGGFVESQRGNTGGYKLARPANELTVGEVIAFMEGNKQKSSQSNILLGDFVGDYVFCQMWKKVVNAVEDIYNNTTFSDLVEQEIAHRKTYVPNYAI